MKIGLRKTFCFWVVLLAVLGIAYSLWGRGGVRGLMRTFGDVREKALVIRVATEAMDNSQMIAQLAQFTSLEQMENLNDSFQEFASNFDQSNFISSSGLLGREITGLDTSGDPVSGIVDGVTMDGSLVYMSVGDQVVSMAGVGSIRVAESDAS